MKIIKRTLSLFLLCLVFAACKKDQGMPTVTDIDGNVYHTVKIGTQTWMVENLKTTHYRNGDPIPNEQNGQNWINLAAGAYADYNNEAANGEVYGHLYNAFAANDARNIAPQGWHVPSLAEYTSLIAYLGGEAVAGGKLKESGTLHWESPNVGATNSSGFKALGAGSRSYSNGNFMYLTQVGYFWTTSTDPQNSLIAYAAQLESGVTNAILEGNAVFKKYGFSVRCIKD